MPLPEPSVRQHLQTRNIQCKGYRLNNGLWDIEGHLLDTRTYPYLSNERGMRAPGQAVHDMWLRLTLDDTLEVKGVACSIDASPLEICCDIEPAFQALVGLRIGPGWSRSVRAILGGAKGCTHLVELLGPIASTAIQTIEGYRTANEQVVKTGSKPQLMNCHAFATFLQANEDKSQ